jgi:hypothetical protein
MKHDKWRPLKDAVNKVMDDLIRDIFANGGPQRPVNGGSRIDWQKAQLTANRRYHQRCRALTAEQRRLIKTWGKD